MFSPWLVGDLNRCALVYFVVPTSAASKKAICAESGAANSRLTSPLPSVNIDNFDKEEKHLSLCSKRSHKNFVAVDECV